MASFIAAARTRSPAEGELLQRHPSLDDRSAKQALVDGTAQAFGPDGISVAASLTDLAQRLGRYAEGQIDKLEVPAWDGPQSQTRLEIAL